MKKANSRVLLVATALLLSGSAAFSQGLTPAPPADVSTFVSDAPYMLPWPLIMEVDILWKKRVWRDIDTREKENMVMGHNATAPRSTVLGNIIVEGVLSEACKAYSAADGGRFTTQLKKNDFMALLTSDSQKPNSGFDPDQFSKYRIKEDWLFLKNEKKMVVRIVGIAPLMEVTSPDGTKTDEPVFWLYYPEIRNFMAKHNVAGKGIAPDMTWDKFFESRSFSSKITRVSGEYTWSK